MFACYGYVVLVAVDFDATWRRRCLVSNLCCYRLRHKSLFQHRQKNTQLVDDLICYNFQIGKLATPTAIQHRKTIYESNLSLVAAGFLVITTKTVKMTLSHLFLLMTSVLSNLLIDYFFSWYLLLFLLDLWNIGSTKWTQHVLHRLQFSTFSKTFCVTSEQSRSAPAS